MTLVVEEFYQISLSSRSYPRKKTKIEKLSPEVGLYSEMAYQNCKKSKSDFVEGPYNKDNSFSEENCIVYVSNYTVVLAIRGTDPKKSKDIFTDIALAKLHPDIGKSMKFSKRLLKSTNTSEKVLSHTNSSL